MADAHPIPKNPRFKNITDQRFERWTVIEYRGKKEPAAQMWLCRCDCGKEKEIQAGNLFSGKSVSCGCYRAEQLSVTKKTHGMRQKNGERLRHPLYDIWVDMRRRCLNKNFKGYKWWGGAGVKICDQWLNDGPHKTAFECFADDIARLIGERPSMKHTLDRISPWGNYEPGNVRWATSVEQGRNKRDNVLYDFMGKKVTRAEAMEMANCPVNEATVRDRLRANWPFEAAITKPARKHRRVAGEKPWE